MKDIAQIPYVVHRLRMRKAYLRERRLKILLSISAGINFLLLAVVIFNFAR